MFGLVAFAVLQQIENRRHGGDIINRGRGLIHAPIRPLYRATAGVVG